MMKEFMTATFADLILRVALAVLLSGPLGTVGIWSAWPIGWCTAAALSIVFYRTGPWYKMQNQEPVQAGQTAECR